MRKINESMSYETILTLLCEDFRKAYSLFTRLRNSVDISEPLPSFSRKLGMMMERSADELEDAWRAVREKYQHIRAEFEIIDERSPLFPRRLAESEYPVPFIYALGNIGNLEKDRITVLGTLSPGKEASRITAEAARFIINSRISLLTPLKLGVSSIAIAETIKESANVIAFSSSFVTKAPNERLMNQMADIYKRGGLIISVTGPSLVDSKWHQAVRNRAVSTLSKSIMLVEEKDGGPSWKIFDEAKDDVPKMLSTHVLDLDGYSFTRERLKCGAMPYSRQSDLKKLLGKKERRGKIRTDLSLTPDLF